MKTKDLKIGMEVAVSIYGYPTHAFIIAIGGWVPTGSYTRRTGGDRFVESPRGSRIGVLASPRGSFGEYWRPELLMPNQILRPWNEYAAERDADQKRMEKLADELDAKENQFIAKLADLGIEGPYSPRQLTDAQFDFILALAARPSPPELWASRNLTTLLGEMIKACPPEASKLVAMLGAYLIESQILVTGLRGPVWMRVHEQMVQLDKAVPWQARVIRLFNGCEFNLPNQPE